MNRRATQALRTLEPPAPLAPPEGSGDACSSFFDLPLSRRCVNRCVFCYSSSGPDGESADMNKIAGDLVAERRRGARRVHLVGGEPTLHPAFFAVLEAAKKLGLETVVVSNGARLSSPDFFRRAAELADELILSLHGRDPAEHGRVTGNPAGFRWIMKALDNASSSARAPRISVNTTATALNLECLPAVARLLRGSAARKYHALNAVRLGRGAERYSELAPRLSECARVLPRAARECWGGGIQFLAAGFPACALGPYHRCSLDWGGEYARAGEGTGLVSFEKPARAPAGNRIDLGRVAAPRCAGCALAGVCGGVDAAYLAERGDAELLPYRAEARA
jgi:MoaA/NifB/PqqE/SkfB family radical SAM enzyme